MIPKIREEEGCCDETNSTLDKKVKFYLKEKKLAGKRYVSLMADDENGAYWYVARISSDGIALISGISVSSGIPVDSNGVIKELSVI